MALTPCDLDVALATAWAAACPGLNLHFLTEKQGWVLEASREPASLVEMAGLLDPSPDLWPVLLSELQAFGSRRANLKMFSIPEGSRLSQENWDTEPFRRFPEYANTHCLVHDLRLNFNLPGSTADRLARLLIRPAGRPARLETLAEKLARQFYPEEPRHTLALALFQGLAASPAVDFLEVCLRESEELIGGLVLLYHDIFCCPAYGFLDKNHRLQGLLYPLLAHFQNTALRPGVRYLIGDIIHSSLKPGLRRLYEKIGARVLYSRCFYVMDLF